MDNKKVLAGFLIFILIMLLFRSSRNNTSTTTTTKVVATRPHYRQRIRDPNYHPGVNPYKAQYYN